MHLVQILLPLTGNDGSVIPHSRFRTVRDELTQRFGGLTAFSRAPAEGLWKDDAEGTTHDDIVVYEVMAESLDRAWWSGYREKLEREFGQEEIVIRAQEMETL